MVSPALQRPDDGQVEVWPVHQKNASVERGRVSVHLCVRLRLPALREKTHTTHDTRACGAAIALDPCRFENSAVSVCWAPDIKRFFAEHERPKQPVFAFSMYVLLEVHHPGADFRLLKLGRSSTKRCVVGKKDTLWPPEQIAYFHRPSPFFSSPQPC